MTTSQMLMTKAPKNIVLVRFSTVIAKLLSISLTSQSLVLHSIHPKTFPLRNRSLHTFCLATSSGPLSRGNIPASKSQKWSEW